jgi:signal transduction histidine kinase
VRDLTIDYTALSLVAPEKIHFRYKLEGLRTRRCQPHRSEVRYDPDHLRLRVRDDGKGIDPKVLVGGQSGHFGIPGMRERAQRIGARLDFWSEPGAGTEAELTVPASMAYQKRDGHRFRLFHRAGS